ncbi:MAG: hypothetical protein FWE19_07640 [Oscillospiraceae bacterium]|nr:hypothetical protein [Oscillospiraceae bacterium]
MPGDHGAGFESVGWDWPVADIELTQPLCEPGFRVRSFCGEVFAVNYAAVDKPGASKNNIPINFLVFAHLFV